MTPASLHELKRLYVDERLTLKEVGERVGMTHSGVLKRLRHGGIEIRPRGGGRRPATKPTPELDALILTMYRAGRLKGEIKRETGATHRHVAQVLEGEPIPKAAREAKGWPAERAAAVVKAYQSGKTVSEVAQLFETSEHRVKGMLARAGVEMRPRGGGGRPKINQSDPVSDDHREACLDEEVTLRCGKPGCGWAEIGTLRDLSDRDAFDTHPCFAP